MSGRPSSLRRLSQNPRWGHRHWRRGSGEKAADLILAYLMSCQAPPTSGGRSSLVFLPGDVLLGCNKCLFFTARCRKCMLQTRFHEEMLVGRCGQMLSSHTCGFGDLPKGPDLLLLPPVSISGGRHSQGECHKLRKMRRILLKAALQHNRDHHYHCRAV